MRIQQDKNRLMKFHSNIRCHGKQHQFPLK